MAPQLEYYARSPDALLVGLARKGDRDAFAELVNRRQNWIRNLMRRFCGNAALADDLSQQTFMQAWRTIHQLQKASRFAPWLKRIATNTWLQYVRKNDPLANADEFDETLPATKRTDDVAIDLDQALATLPQHARLCIVLSYREGMTHDEIAEFTGMPLGTVKSHIRRGTKRLQASLSDYDESRTEEITQ